MHYLARSDSAVAPVADCRGGGDLAIRGVLCWVTGHLRWNDVVTGPKISIIQRLNTRTGNLRLMAEHKHGEMDITVQTKTFNGFIKATTWCVVAIAFLCLFLAVFAS